VMSMATIYLTPDIFIKKYQLSRGRWDRPLGRLSWVLMRLNRTRVQPLPATKDSTSMRVRDAFTLNSSSTFFARSSECSPYSISGPGTHHTAEFWTFSVCFQELGSCLKKCNELRKRRSGRAGFQRLAKTMFHVNKRHLGALSGCTITLRIANIDRTC